ncbi:MAG: DNA repair exonuclease [Oscillospiraceae bacterium]|nr:DNA repair exonuclease [Oscillospiraceae bacterium]
MKILHSADWHLDTAFTGRSEEAVRQLRKALLQVPEKVAGLCRQHGCDLLLLSGDLFDGPCSGESLHILKKVLADVAVPVVITPGNHDFCGPNSPWLTESWPENVHIFTRPVIESFALPELDCRIYGAGYTSMDCPALLEDFHVEGDEKYHIAVLHSDPVQKNAPYCPITQAQAAASGLTYLALGHVHKGGAFRAGNTLCAWPGCPMGRGYDELEEKGVLLVTVGQAAQVEFIPLDGPRFYDLEAEILTSPADALADVLPAVGNDDFYRVTLTGEWDNIDLGTLREEFSHFTNLELRERTVPAPDLWGCIGQDSLEGTYFRLLHDAMEGQDDKTKEILTLAAKISRKILDGREVVLP